MNKYVRWGEMVPQVATMQTKLQRIFFYFFLCFLYFFNRILLITLTKQINRDSLIWSLSTHRALLQRVSIFDLLMTCKQSTSIQEIQWKGATLLSVSGVIRLFWVMVLLTWCQSPHPAVATSIQWTLSEMKLRFTGGVCVCVNGLAPHEQTRMRSLLLPWHPSTRNWDNECWETLEQCNFTSDQLFKRVMTAFMQQSVCVWGRSSQFVSESTRFMETGAAVVQSTGLGHMSDGFLCWNGSFRKRKITKEKLF